MFPVENEYKSFLNKHGGSSNAATGMLSTVYKFNVNSQSFRPALERFSHFFKTPLFREDAIAREVLAVDSEDSKNRILDNRRMLQVMKSLMVPICAYSKFSTGNVNTLTQGDAVGNAGRVREVMRSFHSKHYKPHAMALSLVGPQSMEELTQLAQEMFSDIEGSNSAVEETSNWASPISAVKTIPTETEQSTLTDFHAYPYKESGIVVRVRPVKDTRDISITWGLPPTKELYRSNPCRLLSFLLSHKGPGSLFALLQDKSWATSSSGGIRTEFEDFSIFEMSVSLTPEGLEHWEQVTQLVYDYINIVESASVDELLRIWEEIRVSGRINFKYQQKSTAYELAPDLVDNMLSYPLHHVLSAGYILDELDISQFRQFLALLQPGRAVTYLRSLSFADWIPEDTPTDLEPFDEETSMAPVGKGANRKEPWYGVPYHVQPWVLGAPSHAAQHSVVTASRAPFSLPAPNDFLCYEFAVDEVRRVQEGGQLKPTRSSPPRRVAGTGSLTTTSSMSGNTHIDSAVESGCGADDDDDVSGTDNGHRRRGEEVWHSIDEVFEQPRASVRCFLHSPFAGTTLLLCPPKLAAVSSKISCCVVSLCTSIHIMIAYFEYYETSLSFLTEHDDAVPCSARA